MGEHISLYDPTTQSMLSQITSGLIAAGADAVTATERAYVILHGMLLRQASMVSFVMLFRLLGVLFLLHDPARVHHAAAQAGAAAPVVAE